MKEARRIVETREMLAKHRSLKLPRRMLNRLIGPYPGKDGRKELKRYEMGPDGRIIDDALKAVRHTIEINNSPLIVLGIESRLVTASHDGWDRTGSLPVEIQDDQFKDAIAELVAEKDLVVDDFSEAGLYLPEYEDSSTSPKQISRVGVQLMKGYEPQAAAEFSREDIIALNEDSQATFERLAKEVDSYAA